MRLHYRSAIPPISIASLWAVLTAAFYTQSSRLPLLLTGERGGIGWFIAVTLGFVSSFWLGWKGVKYMGRLSAKLDAPKESLLLLASSVVAIGLAVGLILLYFSPNGLFTEAITWNQDVVGLLDSVSAFAASLALCIGSSVPYSLFRFSRKRAGSHLEGARPKRLTLLLLTMTIAPLLFMLALALASLIAMFLNPQLTYRYEAEALAPLRWLLIAIMIVGVALGAFSVFADRPKVAAFTSIILVGESVANIFYGPFADFFGIYGLFTAVLLPPGAFLLWVAVSKKAFRPLYGTQEGTRVP